MHRVAIKFQVLIEALASLRLTIVCLAALMTLVVGCTLAQIWLGNHEAVRLFIRSPWVLWRHVPVFPGGATVGLLLLLNLVAAQALRLEFNARRAGSWLVHFGLAVLFAGEFVSGLLQVETVMVLRQDVSLGCVESLHEAEIAVSGGKGSSAWEVSLPQSRWRRSAIADARLPFRVEVIESVGSGGASEDSPPVRARLRIVGPGEAVGERTAESGKVLRWTEPNGEAYALSVRPRRYDLGYTLRLKRFIHELYPGTDIPKKFTSVIELDDSALGQRRETLISMNKPLRYRGRAFYQASFDQGGAVSVLQVVDNPGWLLPYISCLLMGLGLLAHFLGRLRQPSVS